MECEMQMNVFTIALPQNGTHESPSDSASVNKHLFPQVSVSNNSNNNNTVVKCSNSHANPSPSPNQNASRAPSEAAKLLFTPTSDYESEALLKYNGMSMSSTSTMMSLKVPRLEISEYPDTAFTSTSTSSAVEYITPQHGRRRSFRRARSAAETDENGGLTEPALTPCLSRPSLGLGTPAATGSHSMLSQQNGDGEGDGDACSDNGFTPRILRLKAKAPTVCANEENGEIEKVTLLEDAFSTCRSSRSLTSAPDRKTSAANFPNVFQSTDPFWQIQMRNVQPPKHPRLKKASHYCRKVITFMGSHIGLFLIVVSYTIIGGFIFPALENERALQIRQELHEQTHNLSEKLLEEVWKIGLEMVTADQYLLEDSMMAVCNHIMQFQENDNTKRYEEQKAYMNAIVLESAKKILSSQNNLHDPEEECIDRKRRSAETEDDEKATGAGSGKANRVTEKFELFSMIWKARNHARLQRRINSMVSKFRLQVFKQTVNGWDGRDTVSHDTQWTFIGAVLYTITVVTTIGYGHMVPRTFEGRVVTIIYSLLGIPLTLLCVANMGSLFASVFRLSYLYVSELFCGESSLYNRWKTQRERKREEEEREGVLHPRKKWLRRFTLRHAASTLGQTFKGIQAKQMLGSATGTDAKTEEQRSVLALIRKDGQRLRRKQKIRVPVSVTFIAISGYLLLGALLFSSTEDWELFNAFYFCYITLSTIGFGDYVPGTQSEEGSQGKLALCSLYLIGGLGMMSMTIQLMQDEVRLKVKRIAEHIGLVKARRATSKEKKPS